jgi:hypothetical protein
MADHDRQMVRRADPTLQAKVGSAVRNDYERTHLYLPSRIFKLSRASGLSG